MKIGLLHGWHLDGSGSNVYTRSLAAALSAQGHEVVIFCQEPEPGRYPGLGAIVVPAIDHAVMPVYVADTDYPGFKEAIALPDLVGDARLDKYLFDWAGGVAAKVQSLGVEVLHANHMYPMPEVARRVKEATGVPYIVYPHGSEIEYALKVSEPLRLAARDAVDDADALVVGNQSVSDRIWRLFPEREADWGIKHSIVSVGVDPSLFSPVEPEDRPASITRLKVELLSYQGTGARKPDADLGEKLAATDWEKARVVLYAGKLLSGKGVADLIRAMPAVFAKIPEAELYIVGEGPDRPNLEELAVSFGSKVKSRIKFTGYLPHSLYKQLLPCAHVAAFPSLVAEAYPLVLMEAISAGVLPAASYFEGLADGLDEIAGRLPPAFGPSMRFSMNPEERAASIEAGLCDILSCSPVWRGAIRRLAETVYSWDSVAKQMAAVYQNVLK